MRKDQSSDSGKEEAAGRINILDLLEGGVSEPWPGVQSVTVQEPVGNDGRGGRLSKSFDREEWESFNGGG